MPATTNERTIAGSGILRSRQTGKHEYACADDRADTDGGECDGAQ